MRLLLTGAWADALNYTLFIEEAGHEVVFLQQEKDLLPCSYDWIEGIVCNSLFLYHPISKFVNLRYIQLTSAGYDRVPMEEIQKRNIEIYNARGVYSIPMAEFALAGVLDLYKGMGQFRDQQKRHEWVKNRNIRELAENRVVIVGCGSVGTECAKRFKAFGCKVIDVDIVLRDDENFDEIKSLERLDNELEKADIVVITLPLTSDTRGLVDRKRLNLIRGVLVNISRGGVVDQKALEIWNGSAVLDVFEDEPLDSESLLWNKHNTIITPHNSFVSEKNSIRLSKLILYNLCRR